MNRGSCDLDRNRHPPSAHFNEAPIHESGKWQAHPKLAADRRHFNEAPIHESGK